jgi:hypothetical protein
MTGNHPKALWPGVMEWFGKSYEGYTREYPDLLEIVPGSLNTEEIVETTGFGLAVQKTQGQSVSYDSDLQGYTTRAKHVTYGLGYIVTREEIEDNKYVQVSRSRSSALRFSMEQTREVIGANLINNGFDASGYPIGDGAAFFSASHPSAVGSQSNLLTAADLSETALEDMLIQIAGAKNNRGLTIALMPQSLFVSRSDLFNATRIVRSTLQNDTVTNAINAVRVLGMLPEGVKVNHFFTDQDAWFVKTKVPSGTGMLMITRRDLEFTKDNDFDTENAKAKATMRFVVTVGDWRSMFGCAGA